ncbi:urease accessory protein UreD [Sulfitobacter noctilucicola]|uniref:Urease accessory protein UreD n=1 Tax=Sulfitobacter noctilucicola TaxID=1342301 RepID=A0A7W6Q6X2_9RHOB|nr:urease accessory protein UreD [Sulfitobacter noctilucicola]MBB4175297.1 urease accessory protein [Sulfitobacter noctilucicola]
MSVGRRTDGSCGLTDLREQGSFRVIFPRAPSGSVEAVILNTAGGIAGGDRYSINATAAAQSCLTLTTQAAERAYGVSDASNGKLDTTITVASGARVNWLPQETILFDGSRLQRKLDVDVAEGAEFVMAEPVVFGREASGETVRAGLFQDSVTIRTGTHMHYIDRVRFEGDMAASLQHRAIGNGAGAMASVVFHSPSAERHLDEIRAMLPDTAGASLLADTILCARILAADGFSLRRDLMPLLQHLTNDTVPKNWRL